MTHSSGPRAADDLEALFEEMISQQRARELALARSLRPRLTEDDILSPLEIPEPADNARFNWEDGLPAGLLSAPDRGERPLQAEERLSEPVSAKAYASIL